MKYIQILIAVLMYSNSYSQCTFCPVEIDNTTFEASIALKYNSEVPSINGTIRIYQKDVNNSYDELPAYHVAPGIIRVYNVPNEYLGVPKDLDIVIGDKKCLIRQNLFLACTQVPPAPPVVACGGELEICRQEIVTFISQNREEFDRVDCKSWNGECDENGSISRSGPVDVGGAGIPSGGYNLAVKNGVVANSVMVRLCAGTGWCDYVFDEKYNLMSFKDLEKFIDLNGHLPGVTSEKEIIADNGFELSKIKREQLEKLEELYLYILELKGKKETLREKLIVLKKQNMLLQK